MHLSSDKVEWRGQRLFRSELRRIFRSVLPLYRKHQTLLPSFTHFPPCNFFLLFQFAKSTINSFIPSFGITSSFLSLSANSCFTLFFCIVAQSSSLKAPWFELIIRQSLSLRILRVLSSSPALYVFSLELRTVRSRQSAFHFFI